MILTTLDKCPLSLSQPSTKDIPVELFLLSCKKRLFLPKSVQHTAWHIAISQLHCSSIDKSYHSTRKNHELNLDLLHLKIVWLFLHCLSNNHCFQLKQRFTPFIFPSSGHPFPYVLWPTRWLCLSGPWGPRTQPERPPGIQPWIRKDKELSKNSQHQDLHPFGIDFTVCCSMEWPLHTRDP